MTILPKKKTTQSKNEGENTDPNHSYHGDRHGHQPHPPESRERFNFSPQTWPPATPRDEKRPSHATSTNFDDYETTDSGPSHSKRRHRASPHRSIRKNHPHVHSNHVVHRTNNQTNFTNPSTSQSGHSPSQDRPNSAMQVKTTEDDGVNGGPSGYNSGDEYDRPIEMWTEEELDEKEKLFEKKLRKKGFSIKKMGEDGACLFRAVADQVYGDQEMHTAVRKLCMDYMAKNSDYFSQYVTEDFEKYIERKRCDHIHGNHIEMQALSEMFNRPIEVYHYSIEPINIFHGEFTDNAPIRLSYHRNIHYNSIVDPYKATIGVGLGLPSLKPGVNENNFLAEKNLMKEAIRTSEEFELEQAMLEDKLRATDWEATNEAIEEQVARESYLEWLRENEMRARKKARSATATSSSSLGSPEMNNGGMSPLQSTGRISPRTRSNFSASNSPKVSESHVEEKILKSPEKVSSPKASNSGLNNEAFNLNNRDENAMATTTASASADQSILMEDEFSLIETASFMNRLPPCIFGLTDWEDSDILARVLAESQQEYLDSLKRSATKDNEQSSS
ncbi:OTU domain-containing protein 5-B isoform X1 [Centruroides vittatus]|uniref:OTU domain-containing protein 5-B isoform X1 n=1 Tax=Centruroides vittatus TaxID=120091 RepID=UPI0035106716